MRSERVESTRVLRYAIALAGVVALLGGIAFAWASTAERFVFFTTVGLAAAVLVSLLIIQLRRLLGELEVHRHRLEELVEARTAELEAAQAQLIRGERLAVLGRLTATIAHELRNPLGTVKNSITAIGKLGALEGTPVGDRLVMSVSRASRNVARCDRIIDELLDFVRETPLAAVETDLDGFVRGLLDEEKIDGEMPLECSLDSGARVAIDRERLGRALVNVIQNAAQAMDGQDEQLLKISTRSNGEECAIVVEDCGGGISKEDAEHIFEPLFSTKSFGVGLGLCVVKDALERHRGRVAIESEVGQGTQVTLSLPLSAGTVSI